MKTSETTVNLKHTLSGVCLILFFIFSEAIPLGGNMEDLPRLFSIQFFIPNTLNGLSVLYLLLPSSIFLFIALQPMFVRPPLLEHALLIIVGFSFYPIVFFFREHVQHPYTNEGSDALLWALLFVAWIGFILWSRSRDFLWASAAAAPLWDMGAAIRGVMLDVERIGVPYHQGLPPKLVILIDASLCFLCLFLWWRKANPLPQAEKLWKRWTNRPSDQWLNS